MAKTVKKFLFKMSAGQIIASLLIVAAFIIFLIVRAVMSISAGSGAFTGLVLLTLFLLLSRMSIIVKVGVGFLPFILLPVLMFFGPIVCFVMIFVTSGIYIWQAVRPTPIDFAITKQVATSVAQTVYLSFYVLAMIPFVSYLGVDYILANLVPMYMISVLVYVIFMVICLPILAREPIPQTLINGMIMFPVQLFLISYFGVQFFAYVAGLG